MRLAEFIREALRDIALGVHGAKSDIHELVAIVPGHLNGTSMIEKTYVEFDIAVSAASDDESKSGSSAKAGAGISVVGVKLGTDGALNEESLRKNSNSLTSRIGFKVPIYLNAHFRGDDGSQAEADFVMAKWHDVFGDDDSRNR